MTTEGLQPGSRFSYLAALDPWRNSSTGDIEWLLKLAALTSRRLVISDNQALNNLGFRRLLRRPDVTDFLYHLDADGGPVLSLALREGTNYFEYVARRLVVGRERPAIFPWMSSRQQARLDASYGTKGSVTLGPLFDIAGRAFRDHIERLEKLRRSNAEVTLRWSGLETGYISAASRALERFQETVKRESPSKLHTSEAVSLCADLLEQIQSGTEVNRSNLYRTIELSDLSNAARLAIRLKCLDEPYHDNFSAVTHTHSITGIEYREAEVAKLLDRIAGRLLKLEPVDVFEIDEFPVLLDEVPFARLSTLRASSSFIRLLDELATTTEAQHRVRVIRDLLNCAAAEFAKEPKGLRKISRLRLHVLAPPRELIDDLVASGLSLSDVVAFASKATGFIVGEAVGQLVGVFGIGGALGTGAAMVIEQVSRRAYEKPKKRREFQQVLQLLAATPVAKT